MSKIEDLIKQYCPDGVEYKELGEVANISTGLNPRKNFILNTYDADKHYVTVKEITSGEIKFGDNTDKINLDAWNIIQKRSNVQQGSVLLSGIGTIGKVAVVTDSNFDWNCSESIYVINPNLSELDSYFLKYYLESSQIQYLMHRKSQGGTLKGIRRGDLKRFMIPIPHIAVQDEIVRILDKFTELEKELEKELELRRKQYEFYRDKLLTFGDEVERERLGDVTNVCRGKRVVKRELSDSVGHPVYQNSLSILGYYMDSNYPANTSFVIGAGAAGEIGYSLTDFWAADDCFPIICKGTLLDRFVFYFLMQNQAVLKSKVRKASIPRLSRDEIENLIISIPSPTEQERIVKILDKFDTLTTSLTSGLPAEIKLRKQQYEYYRDYLFGLLR